MAKKTLSLAYNPEVDFWKLVFALVIFFRHTVYFNSSSPVLQRGYLSVEFFFLVSGFFLAEKVRSESAKEVKLKTSEFLRHKISGLYKPVLGAFLITFAVRETLSFISVPNSARNLILGVYELIFARAYGVTVTKAYNGPVWYIASMLAAMTVLYPLAMKFRQQFLRVACPVLALFSYGIMLQQFKALNLNTHILGGFLVAGTLRAFAGLCAGMFVSECAACLKKAMEGKTVSRFGRVFFSLLEAAAAAAVFLHMQLAEPKGWPGETDYIVVLFFACFCFLVFSGLTGLKERLRGVDFTPLARISLYLYLCQWAGTYIMREISDKLSFGWSLACYAAITAGAMVLCRFLVFLMDLFGAKCVPFLKKLLFPKKIS